MGMIRTYVPLKPGHPFRLVANLVDFDFERHGGWDR